ncbi:uncharacterized protein K444DRAFT_17246 [Hyaloscypha bicolor E]|uniref:Zn(2)-C6 fungal-type domain-containing protein n=1 Tax=Hyaloscypha bicolor E TaxID=1095630 RepID=A0A2J6TWW1_9HELO|nr:uncharacterized protein K444DRAFT_17246 [Hyaloscypha bicolor E]PMD67522.1 hypothetical protein K444DRAFT_17246 [Hyaloscypha bicolor E]
MGQLYDPLFTGLDAHAMDPPSSGDYDDLSMSHGDPSLYFPNLWSSTLPQTSHSGIGSDQFGMQQVIPTPGLCQTPMQSVLQVIPYRQPPNSTQYISTSSSFQQESPSQDQMTGKATRTRPRSPESAQEQQLSAFRQQVSKSKGVPGFLLSEFCADSDPTPKRSRTSAQKKNKNDVEKAGGACFLCRMIKKRCSGQRPCDTCRQWWDDTCKKWRAESCHSTSFMWMCDVATKLTDFKIFNLPSDTTLSAKRIESFDLEKGSHAYRRKYTHLLLLMDDLEPNELGGFSKMFGKYFYISQSFQWRAVLLYLAPELRSFLAFQELQYRDVCLSTLKFCDLAHKPGRPKDIIVRRRSH